MSNLDRDIARSAALGMSYGRYKMEHPGEPVVEKPKPVEVKPEKPPNAVCGICGKPFRKRKGNQKYCSDTCSYEALCRRTKAEYHKKAPPKTERTCPYCGIVFMPNTRAQKFCGKECRRLNELENKRINNIRRKQNETVHRSEDGNGSTGPAAG